VVNYSRVFGVPMSYFGFIYYFVHVCGRERARQAGLAGEWSARRCSSPRTSSAWR
jgi:hypothetical protein